MIAELMLVLAQGLVVDGTRYRLAEDGRLQASRVADERVLYDWWPDPPAQALTGRLAAGDLAGRKYLAAGLGTGTGLYVLDISDPDQARAQPVRVFTEEGVVGRLDEVLVFALVGPDRRPFVLSSAGHGAPRPGLLMVPLDRHGSHLLEVHSPGATLGAVAVARRPDGRVSYAYAGDSLGRMWRFDLTGDTPWIQPKQRKPIFSATRPDGVRQPVQAAPAVMFGPDGGYLVAFGTSGASGNTLYTYHDRLGPPRNAGRDDLARRRSRREGDGQRIEGPAFDYRERSGWFLDLRCGEGERVAGLQARGGLLIASTVLDQEEAGCTYAFLSLTGLAPDKALTGKRSEGLLEDAELIAIGPEQVLERSRNRTTREHLYQLARRDADGHLHKVQEVRITRRYGRLSWREIPHWRSLHQAARRAP